MLYIFKGACESDGDASDLAVVYRISRLFKIEYSKNTKKHNLTGYATVVDQIGKASQFPSNGKVDRD